MNRMSGGTMGEDVRSISLVRALYRDLGRDLGR
jgi:hypothetical protein